VAIAAAPASAAIARSSDRLDNEFWLKDIFVLLPGNINEVEFRDEPATDDSAVTPGMSLAQYRTCVGHG
jgi:hypothetical protein